MKLNNRAVKDATERRRTQLLDAPPGTARNADADLADGDPEIAELLAMEALEARGRGDTPSPDTTS